MTDLVLAALMGASILAIALLHQGHKRNRALLNDLRAQLAAQQITTIMGGGGGPGGPGHPAAPPQAGRRKGHLALHTTATEGAKRVRISLHGHRAITTTVAAVATVGTAAMVYLSPGDSTATGSAAPPPTAADPLRSQADLEDVPAAAPRRDAPRRVTSSPGSTSRSAAPVAGSRSTATRTHLHAPALTDGRHPGRTVRHTGVLVLARPSEPPDAPSQTPCPQGATHAPAPPAPAPPVTPRPTPPPTAEPTPPPPVGVPDPDSTPDPDPAPTPDDPGPGAEPPPSPDPTPAPDGGAETTTGTGGSPSPEFAALLRLRAPHRAAA